jgi:hypothetical protein
VEKYEAVKWENCEPGMMEKVYTGNDGNDYRKRMNRG